MLYLYAIAERGSGETPELRGLGDVNVRALRTGDFVAVVSEHDGLALVPTGEAVARHADVVERLMSAGTTVLPARFGHAFADDSALAAAVERRAPALHAALALVRGCVELGVRVLRRGSPAAEPWPAPSSGREYMQARLERQARRVETVVVIHERLARLSIRNEQRPLATSALLLSAAYLVRRERVDEFRSEAARLQRERTDVALVVTGPWPPYSFAPEAA